MTDQGCAICGVGRLRPGKATVSFDDDQRELTVVIRHVPAEGVCDCCGEPYFDEQTARSLLAQIPEGDRRRVIVRDYSA